MGNGKELTRNGNVNTQELLTDKSRFDQLWRWAKCCASSQMVPQHFRSKPEDCFIATMMAMRLGVEPTLLMQNTYFIQGKPGMESKFAIALANGSGVFRGPIQYEMSGTGDQMQSRAYAIIDATGEVAEETVAMSQAHAEGWTKKTGSKWKTLPSLMLKYRSAMFLIKLHCPEVLMGLQSTQELADVTTPAAQCLDDLAQTPFATDAAARRVEASEIEEQGEEVF